MRAEIAAFVRGADRDRECSYEVRTAAAAAKDIAQIRDWSLKHFRHNAAVHDDALIVQAFTDIAEDPRRPGARPSPDLLLGLWLYTSPQAAIVFYPLSVL